MKRSVLGWLLVGMLVTACGGGGGGGGSADTTVEPRASLALTADNTPLVSAAVLDGVFGVTSVGDDLPLNLTSLASNDGVATIPGPKEFVLSLIDNSSIYPGSQGPVLGLAVVETVTLDADDGVCTLGGSVTVTIDTAGGDPANFPTPGSSVAMTFNNCNDVDFGTVNGALKITFTEITGMPAGELGVAVFTMRLDVVFTNLVFTGSYGVDGDLTLVSDSDGGGVYVIDTLGNYLKVTIGTRTVAQFNYMLSERSSGGTDRFVEFDFVLDDSVLGGSVTAATLVGYPLVIDVNNTYPHSGQVLITGANGSNITLIAEADATNVTLLVDTNGDGTPDENPITKTWQELDDQIPSPF